MTKKTETDNNNEEMNFDAFLDDFEKTGAALSAPVLPEGKYKANVVAFSARNGIATPTKGPNAGKENIWCLWQMRLALDSVQANALMKRDGDILVYADNDTMNLRKGNLALAAFGIAKDNNAGLWTLVGNLLHPVGHAEEIKQDNGESSFTISRAAIDSIYANTKSKMEELQADSELDARLIPAKLAEMQLQNLTEFVTGEEETRKVYLHIAKRSNYQDKNKQEHFIKQILFAAEFEEKQSNMDSLID